VLLEDDHCVHLFGQPSRFQGLTSRLPQTAQEPHVNRTGFRAETLRGLDGRDKSNSEPPKTIDPQLASSVMVHRGRVRP
jgi:hypothetical protein